MRNWIESELELLLTIISMRSRILFIPTLGVVIGIVLTIYLDYSLTNYISNNQDSVYQLLNLPPTWQKYHLVSFFSDFLKHDRVKLTTDFIK